MAEVPSLCRLFTQSPRGGAWSYRLTWCFGGAEGIRTPDLLIANETRYQLRHSPNASRTRWETLAPGSGRHRIGPRPGRTVRRPGAARAARAPGGRSPATSGRRPASADAAAAEAGWTVQAQVIRTPVPASSKRPQAVDRGGQRPHRAARRRRSGSRTSAAGRRPTSVSRIVLRSASTMVRVWPTVPHSPSWSRTSRIGGSAAYRRREQRRAAAAAARASNARSTATG